MKVRLLDVGSTNIKTALYDENSRLIFDKKSIAFPIHNLKKPPFYEIAVDEIEKSIFSLVDKNDDALFICTQMHGYVLMENGRAVSNYVSWKDTRASLDKPLEPIEYWHGVSMKANLSKASILYTKNHEFGLVEKASEFCSLGSYISYRLCGNNSSHITDLAASGFYDSRNGEFEEFFLKLPTASMQVVQLGKFGNCAVYSPVGDQQAAVYGTDYENALILNVGTASQACCVSDKLIHGEFESRPFFNAKTLCTISGLPGGEYMSKTTDSELFDLLYSKWANAFKKLPEKNRVIVTGGIVKYRKSIIERVLGALGVKYEFSNGEETFSGLSKIARECLI